MINTPSPETLTISVFDQIGKKIYEINNVYAFGKTEIVIDLGFISTGIYVVEFKNDLHTVRRTMLVNR